MTFRLENVGNETLSFSSDTERFGITVSDEGPRDNVTLYGYRPPLPEFRLPAKLGPGEAFVQTLTLLGDGSTPLSILRVNREANKFVHTNTWWNSSLNPGKYRIQGVIDSRSLELHVSGGQYEVTITEEKWQP